MTKKERLLAQYSQWLGMGNYSKSTHKAYLRSVRHFWRYCEQQQRNPRFEKATAVQSFLSYRLNVQKRDYSTVNGDYSALQWFYKYVLNRDWNVNKLIRPKKEKRLPRYLTPEQIGALLAATQNEKHRLLMLLYYSTGLRLSEGRLLKWEDVNISQGTIMVKCGKGAKDRIAILPSHLGEQLLVFRQLQRSTQRYIFEGKDLGEPLSCRTIQSSFAKARKKADLPEWTTAHVLRHSFATTSLKNGTDLLTLKELLGHRKLETTLQYLHLNLPHLKKTYNPLSDPCLRPYLQLTPPPDSPNQTPPKVALLTPPSPIPNTPSGVLSANLEQPMSKNTNPTIESERS